jgi:hypothetical protein
LNVPSIPPLLQFPDRGPFLAWHNRLDEFGDEIAALAAHFDPVTQRRLALIAEFDQRRGWEWGGHRSCAFKIAFGLWLQMGFYGSAGVGVSQVRCASLLLF